MDKLGDGDFVSGAQRGILAAGPLLEWRTTMLLSPSIVQGCYDVVCPMMSAWDLHKAWPEAKFQVVTSFGHSTNEARVLVELVAAMEYLKNKGMIQPDLMFLLEDVHHNMVAYSQDLNFVWLCNSIMVFIVLGKSSLVWQVGGVLISRQMHR